MPTVSFASLVVMPFVSWTNPHAARQNGETRLFRPWPGGWRTAASNLIGYLIYGRVIGPMVE